MLETDPASEEVAADVHLYECPECGGRVEARGSCCCSDCGCRMQNLSQPRHR
jgi:ABC-type ATPase with predicted acetyltransferase domain